MKHKGKKRPLPLLFTVVGMAAGLIYYYVAVCADGMCPISSGPFLPMFCMGVVGWLLSGLFGGEYRGSLGGESGA